MGRIMVIHDETVDRTTNGKGAVNQFSVLELKQFKMEKEQRIPTLSEVLNLINQKCKVNIELKSYETADKVVDLIEHFIADKYWNYNQFIVSSFDWNALQQVVF
jgi:glycerophosphoryl diester phosphodiesterase